MTKLGVVDGYVWNLLLELIPELVHHGLIILKKGAAMEKLELLVGV